MTKKEIKNILNFNMILRKVIYLKNNLKFKCKSQSGIQHGTYLMKLMNKYNHLSLNLCQQILQKKQIHTAQIMRKPLLLPNKKYLILRNNSNKINTHINSKKPYQQCYAKMTIFSSKNQINWKSQEIQIEWIVFIFKMIQTLIPECLIIQMVQKMQG